jgi:hypothetical protein
MRKLLFILTLLSPTLCLSDTVTCYEHGKRIYYHHAHEISYAEGILAFSEDSTDRNVFTTMNCIIKIDA